MSAIKQTHTHGPTPDYETIKREGWDTPAAEYWQKLFDKCQDREERLLIVNADLLAACERLENVAHVHIVAHGDRPGVAYNLRDACNAARAAIAKARGGSHE